MDELIWKQDALDAFNGNVTISAARNAGRVYTYLKMVTDRIKALPPVQPEIIHCKDCIRFKKPSALVDADWGWCSGWPTPLTTFVKVDGFCHRAEKRGEAE